MNPRNSIVLFCLGLILICQGCNRSGNADQGSKAKENSAFKPDLLDPEIARIRTSGEPVTLDELNSWYSEPRENAADALAKAFAGLTGDFEGILAIQVHLPEHTAPLDVKAKNTIATFLSRNKESLALLHQATRIKDCRYPVDLKQGIQAQLPHLESIRKSAQLLQMAAIFAAEQGQGSQAVEANVALLRLGNSLRNEPVLRSQSVRMYCNGLSFIAARRILNRIQLQDGDLSSLLTAFAEAESPKSITRSYVAARAVGISILQMPPDQQKQFFTAAGLNLQNGVELSAEDVELYMGTMGDLIARSQVSASESAATMEELKARAAKAVEQKYLFCSLMLPQLNDFVGMTATDTGRLRCPQVALGVERYRLAHQGQLPPALSELVPSLLSTMPSDPVAGTPFNYQKKTASHFEIASSGKGNQQMVSLSVER